MVVYNNRKFVVDIIENDKVVEWMELWNENSTVIFPEPLTCFNAYIFLSPLYVWLWVWR